ncbi:hypothetical protein STEG23_026372 [Scotinomys teguina]
MQPGRTTNTGGGTMEVKAAAPRCQLLLILLMSVVMLLPGTNGSLLLVQRTVTRTIVLQETIGKGFSIMFLMHLLIESFSLFGLLELCLVFGCGSLYLLLSVIGEKLCDDN